MYIYDFLLGSKYVVSYYHWWLLTIYSTVDIDENSELAIEHGVQAVPTVVAFKDGEMVDKFVGLVDEDKLGAFVRKLHD